MKPNQISPRRGGWTIRHASLGALRRCDAAASRILRHASHSPASTPDGEVNCSSIAFCCRRAYHRRRASSITLLRSNAGCFLSQASTTLSKSGSTVAAILGRCRIAAFRRTLAPSIADMLSDKWAPLSDGHEASRSCQRSGGPARGLTIPQSILLQAAEMIQ